MKKPVTVFLALSLVFSLAACSKETEETTKASKETEMTTTSEAVEETTTSEAVATESTTDITETEIVDTSSVETEDISSKVPEGAVTDETKLGESITSYVDGDYLYFKIKTSADFNANNVGIKIVNPGFYLKADSDFITQCIYDNIRCLAKEFDKEWFDGTYVYWLDNNIITDIASDESEWTPGTWSVLLYDGDTNFVIGEWFIVLDGGGKYHFDFKDSWLYGAGEDKPVKEFETPQEEIASWFTYSAEETYDEWATFYFDGFYLEEVDSEGYDHHYMMVCPEGNYTTYEEADAVDLTYCDIGEKCPYRFSFEQYGIAEGTYTIVIAQMGGEVEVQFTATKTGDQWELDFTNATSTHLPA